MISHSSFGLQSRPDYWSVLNDAEKIGYLELRQLLGPLAVRTTRHDASMKLQVALGYIKHFAIRHNDDDWKRCLVCGILWTEEAIGLNMRQFPILLGRSKSSINAGFLQLGYSNGITNSSHIYALIHNFPFLKRRPTEIRQWTFRELLLPQQLRQPRVVLRKQNDQTIETQKVVSVSELWNELPFAGGLNDFPLSEMDNDTIDCAFNLDLDM
jgi:hypothetical protein